MVILILIVLGLCLGSFVNAYVWRVHKRETSKSKKPSKKYSITHGRSMCVHCEHTLAVKDLVPVFSWLSLRGKCRYCHKPISAQYPLVEALTAVLFVVSYLAWPMDWNGQQWAGFGLWLAMLTSLIALAVYDLKWMILPNLMLKPLAFLAAINIALPAFLDSSIDPVLSAFWGVVIGGGLFYVLFQVSNGKWIGGGDVKLGAVLGLIVGGPMNGILLLLIASLAGTLLAVPLLLTGRAKRSTRLPFGPFLIMASIVVFLWGTPLVDWYNSILL